MHITVAGLRAFRYSYRLLIASMKLFLCCSSAIIDIRPQTYLYDASPLSGYFTLQDRLRSGATTARSNVTKIYLEYLYRETRLWCGTWLPVTASVRFWQLNLVA